MERPDYTHAQRLDVSKKVDQFESIRDRMAMKYPFELDPFQQQAVYCMENGESVFVAAHTSAGKTVVAEYAVALGRKNGTRVIYTSPIKALSNQKFRDFKHMFDDVGLITGDIQVNSEAYCLIMTTEILRSMLYNGSEVVRELEWVIFDEVHYINDIERGHVWEEVLIMLPAHVKIVMLSATVPNCLEFADWVGRIKNRKINVIQTLKRPVPLEHFLYTGQDGKTKKDIFLIFDKDANFLTSGYQKAVEAKVKKQQQLMAPKPGTGGGGGGGGHGQKQQQGRGQQQGKGQQPGKGQQGQQQGRGNANGQQQQQGRGGGQQRKPPPQPQQGGGWGPVNSNSPWQLNKNNKNVYINLIDHLRTEELLPMIVFIFSRQRCDETAQLLHSVDLTTANEKSAIHRFFNRCIDRLTGTDKELPQVLLMQELCKRGFAVHHSGILPIIKETVELLFQQGLVKILFATETFAMGVNMPARTVVFDGIEKHDGKERRLLNSTEYVQMAGRAGRRGLDSTGTVIILAKGPEPPDIASLKTILQGKPIKLESRFRITYGMMLNLLRVEHLRIEEMLQRSYVERASLRLVVSRKDRLKQIDEQISQLAPIDCPFCIPPPHLPNGQQQKQQQKANANANDVQPPNSLLAFFKALTDYYEAVAETWAQLVAKSKESKLFGPGRVLVIHWSPLGLVGQLAVVLRIRNTDSGQPLLTLMVPISAQQMKKNAEEEAIFKGLTKEERKWRLEALWLRHALTNGIEGIAPVQAFDGHSSFLVLEDVGLESLMAVCKRTIPKVDADSIVEEFKRLNAPSVRSQSPDRNVRKVLLELEQLADKFETIKEQLQREANDEPTTAISMSLGDLVHILGEDMERKELDLVDRLRRVREMRQQLLGPQAFPCTKCPDIQEHMDWAIKRSQLEQTKSQLVYQTSPDSLLMSQEYVGRMHVLRTLNYIDKQNMVGLKGKVACEISNQELLLTELILDNKFNERSLPEIAAMLSTLTCQFDTKSNGNNSSRRGPQCSNSSHSGGKTGTGNWPSNNCTSNEAIETEQQQPKEEEEPVERVSRELLRELEADLIEAANRIDTVQRAFKVVSSPVVDEIKFGLMEVVYQWASGMEFSKIMRLSEAQEGIIVRCIQRLDEVCKDVRKAALIVGSPELAEKMEETSAAIRRDIVFAASLYVTE